MSNIWKPRPPSFPPDDRIPFTAAECNEFDDTEDLKIRNNERNESKDDIELDSMPKSKLYRARDSVYVRQKQRNSVVSTKFESSDEDSMSDTQSTRNVRFSSNVPPNEGIDNKSFEGDNDVFEEEVVYRKKTAKSALIDPTNYFNSDSEEERNNNGDSEKKKDWDVFKTLPPPDDDETLDGAWVEFFIKCLKIFVYILTFVVTLGCAVVSKSLILLMTSMIRLNRKIAICNDDIYPMEPPLDLDKRYTTDYFNSNDPQRNAWIWCLFFAIIAPDVFAFGRSLRICYFKTYKIPTYATFLTVLLFETFYSIGISLLVFLILPTIDVIKGSMITNSLCLIPGILILLKQNNFSNIKHLEPKLANDLKYKAQRNEWIVTFGAIIAQLLGLVIWPLIAYFDGSDMFWYLPLALVLISFNWWENFLNHSSRNTFIKHLLEVQKDLAKSRYFTYALISIWKGIVVFAVMILIVYLNDTTSNSKNSLNDFMNFTRSFKSDTIRVIRDKTNVENSELIDGESHIMTITDTLIPVWILLIQIGTTYMCYAFAKFSCKTHIQTFSFAIPVNLVVPVTVSFLWVMIELSVGDNCRITNFFNGFQYIYWFTTDGNTFNYYSDWKNYVMTIMWILSLVSQIVITIHIWSATSARLASTEELFISPMYSSILIDQSLAMNRRRLNLRDEVIKEDEESAKKEEEANDNFYESVNDPMSIPEPLKNVDSDKTVRIFACATMWHENKEEMIQMLKAVMRLDEDQCSRKNAQNFFQISPNFTDYYEIEFNIYFDDAFDQGLTDEVDDRVVNRFVKQLIETMDEAATNVHGTIVHLKKPTVVPTPYGGRLEWTLPGQNRLLAHLKDKILIRHRKRWSQCMYLYYLLGHRIAELPIDEQRKETISMNTFILALDGDINFRPHALHLVVDLMKKNKRLGAACGRIHPIGSGPMVWYQKFEYAIGHWLQKATEHVFGCVLCSPGCFSLFRARAVMDDSVMNKYTTKPTEALHYVQYDQGEDRWLCTLLLQQGWRIEYCAASDSYTHAPEGFGEFYTQRRRWAPSTMANILDLLGDYKRTVERNTDISKLYILYQAMLLLGTILSPGTIFLMVVGAMNTVMNFDTKISLAINIVPILFFSIICLVLKKNDHIILVAMILSTIYALLMLAVLVGTAMDISNPDIGILAPNSIFFLGMMGSFLVAAILHPQEFACVLPLLLYMLLIPSMYLLLTIYSVTNMHVVSWGTREVKSKLTLKEQKAADEAAKAALEAKSKKKNMLGFLDFSRLGNKSGLFTCMCCSNSRAEEESAKLSDIREQLTKVNENINNIKSNIEPQRVRRSSVYSRRRSFTNQNDGFPILEEEEEEDDNDSNETNSLMQDNPNEGLPNNGTIGAAEKPKWAVDQVFTNFPYVKLTPNEQQFWDDFIPKYLLPLDENPAEQARIANDLKELRNRVVFAFGIINTIFILFVYLLQMHKDVFGIDLPAGLGTPNKTYIEETDSYVEIPTYKYVRMDPIGLVLIIFFGAILVIQLIGMFMHRFGTLSHLLAFTSIDFFDRRSNNVNEKFDEKFNRNAVQLTKKIQKQGVNEINEMENKSTNSPLNRRMSVFARPQAPQPLDLNEAFKKRIMSIKPNSLDVPTLQGMKRKSVGNVLAQRRKSVDWRRISIAPELHHKYKLSVNSINSSIASQNPQNTPNFRPKSLTFRLDEQPKRQNQTLINRSASNPSQSTPTGVGPKVTLTPVDNRPPSGAFGQHTLAYYNLVKQNVANDLSADIIRKSLTEFQDLNKENEDNGNESAEGSSGSTQQEVRAQIHSSDSDSSTNTTVSSNIDFNFVNEEMNDNSSIITNNDDFPVTTFQPTVVSLNDRPMAELSMNIPMAESGNSRESEEISTRL